MTFHGVSRSRVPAHRPTWGGARLRSGDPAIYSTEDGMQWMVIYAPQGAGKSLLASAIARHFGLVRVLDGECWRPEEGVPAPCGA